MKHLYLSSLILMNLFMISCSRYYYKPNGVNTPLFTDKGQLHLNAAGSTGDGDGAGKTGFFDGQAAWSPVKHLGIIGNYSTYRYTPDKPDPASGNVNAKAYLLEGGVGGYYAIGGRNVKMVVDMYGGYGAGTIRSDVNLDVSRLFLQPGIGMTSPWFDASFNMRFSNVHYSNLNDNGRGVEYLEAHNLESITDGSYTFAEPSFTIRAGYTFAKVQFQSVFANSFNDTYWRYNGARFTAGFYFSLEGLMDVIRNGVEKPELPPLPPLPEHRHL